MTYSSILVEFDQEGSLARDATAILSTSSCRITSQSFFPQPRLHRWQGRDVVLCGHPIANGKRSDAAVLDTLSHAPDLARGARELDGSFLILVHDAMAASLTVISDRFSGIPFHYRRGPGRLVGGSSFRQVLEHARTNGGGTVDPDQVLTFLWLRRLLGEATLASDITYLPAAAILDMAASAPERYWQPDLGRRGPTGSRLVAEIADGLAEAMATHMSDSDRTFGLLLSGGLDSRALLAAAPRPPACFTTCLSRNNEFRVAEDVAAIAGARHHFIPRSLAPLDGRLDEAAALGGMQVYNEAQFLGYGGSIGSDVVMIGLGLDIFFGGLYLPKVPASLAGRDLLHHRLLPLPTDFAGFYLDKVKYRLKTSDPLSVVRPEVARRARDVLRAQVEAVAARGRALGGHGYSLWEYMHLHTLSRHYSFPMMASVRTFAECRAPALSKRLLDLAHGMAAADKLDGTPYQAAVARLNPAMMAVRNANTNMPAAWSLRRQSIAKAGAYLLRKLGRDLAAARSPGWRDRSWPLPKAQLESSPDLMERVRALPGCPILEETGIFDPGKIAVAVGEHLDGRHDHTVLFNLLLTLSSTLRPHTRTC